MSSSFSLAPRHRSVVYALGDALFHHPDGPSAEQLDILVTGVEQHLAPVSRPQRFMLLLALELVRWLPFLLFAGFDTFDGLSVDRRLRILVRMDRSRLIILLMPLVAFKTLFAMLFFEQAAELRAMGYPGDDRKRWLRLAA
jgi:hypothetical protein